MAYITKHRGRFKVRWRLGDGTTRSASFDTAREAKAKRAEVERDQATGDLIDPRHGRQITVGQYASQWAACQVWSPGTVASVETRFRRHVLPRLENRPLGSVRPTEIQALVRQWSMTLAPSTTTTTYRFLSAMFAAAVRDRLIPSNPCMGTRLPKVDGSKAYAPGVDEVGAIIDAAPARLRAAYVLAALTGARPGEVFGATADRIDWLRRTWRIDRQMLTPAKGDPYLAPCKTTSSVRVVALTDATVRELAEHVRLFPPGPDGLLFTDDQGRPWRRNRLSETWHRTNMAAGVAGLRGMHALRHHHASVLLAGGASIKSVSDRLGHRSARETLDVYAHMMRGDDDTTRAVLDAAWSTPSEAKEQAR